MIDNLRMLDLLRVCRAQLFVEEGLITDEEYAYLASLRVLRDTQRISKPEALGLMYLIQARVEACCNATAIARMTQRCRAVIKRYGGGQ